MGDMDAASIGSDFTVQSIVWYIKIYLAHEESIIGLKL